MTNATRSSWTRLRSRAVASIFATGLFLLVPLLASAQQPPKGPPSGPPGGPPNGPPNAPPNQPPPPPPPPPPGQFGNALPGLTGDQFAAWKNGQGLFQLKEPRHRD